MRFIIILILTTILIVITFTETRLSVKADNPGTLQFMGSMERDWGGHFYAVRDGSTGNICYVATSSNGLAIDCVSTK